MWHKRVAEQRHGWRCWETKGGSENGQREHELANDAKEEDFSLCCEGRMHCKAKQGHFAMERRQVLRAILGEAQQVQGRFSLLSLRVTVLSMKLGAPRRRELHQMGEKPQQPHKKVRKTKPFSEQTEGER